MRSLVLGGNGFISVHLVERLVKNGHKVRIYDWSLSRFRAVLRGAEYLEEEPGGESYTELREGDARVWDWICSLSESRVES